MVAHVILSACSAYHNGNEPNVLFQKSLMCLMSLSFAVSAVVLGLIKCGAGVHQSPFFFVTLEFSGHLFK